MFEIYVWCLILGLIKAIKCDLSLQIIKNTENTFTPVTLVVEEKIGAQFSLLCELVSSVSDNTYFDDQISWGRETNDFKFANESDLENHASKKTKELYVFLSRSEVNKAVKHFSPYRLEDKGVYFCMSLKYQLFKIVNVTVWNEIKIIDDNGLNRGNGRPYREYLFCNEDMFKCMSNGACINQHYVCDGKPDCKDGSDESNEKCNGDPCKDKLHCDDGRCIPTAWCCDRHHDLNCTVTNRPTCCQLLSERILSTFFSIVLLLLILSKVVIFAKKSAYIQARNNHNSNLDGIALNHRSDNRRNYRCDIQTYRNNIRHYRNNRNIVLDTIDVSSNPLLVPYRNGRDLRLDQPPAYSEVVSNNNAINITEPPPPYTSREVLNNDDENNRTDGCN